MGLLTMNEPEYQYYVDNIREAFMLIGQEATLYEVDKEVRDMYWDPETTHKEGKEISLIFEQNPKPYLDHFNWRTESKEDAYVAHIVAKSNDGTPIEIREFMLIELHNQFGLVQDKLFMVSEVRGSSMDPLTWICKLVPYRYKTDVDLEKPGYQPKQDEENKDTDFSMLKVSKYL